jgi:hypothetical protein
MGEKHAGAKRGRGGDANAQEVDVDAQAEVDKDGMFHNSPPAGGGNRIISPSSVVPLNEDVEG